MKVLETRPVSEGISLMSWSPKMDLIALGTTAGEIFLHRLSWQKVWQLKVKVSSSEAGASTIRLMAWHPDGVFLAVVASGIAFIVDVESGRIVHRHELDSKIVSIKWCFTEYELSMDETLASQARQQSDFMKNELKLQRLESTLSVLIISTADGRIQVYTGGFLYAMVLKIPFESNKCEILHVDASKSLQMLQVLSYQTDDNGKLLCLSQFKTNHFEKISPVIGPLGFKYLFFIKNWNNIQSEITSMEDQWGKLVDLYFMYMTYGSDKELPEVRADYMELLFTGVSTVELEIFLGKAGREKEIKKHTNIVNSTYGTIMEHLRSIKSALTFALMELNEIGGFLKIYRMTETEPIVANLRKSFTYLYIGALHIQSLVQNFMTVFLNFFHLLLNTIHLYNIQEVPDFIEEDADVSKILSFLDIKIDNSIFNFLILNAPSKFPDPPPSVEVSSVVRKGDKSLQFPFSFPTNDQKWTSFPILMKEYLESHKEEWVGQNLVLDFTQEEVLKLFCKVNLPRSINELVEKLFSIPCLSTLPFSVSTYPLAVIPKTKTEVQCEKSGLRINHNGSGTLIFYCWDSNTAILFKVLENNPLIRAYSLNFCRKIVCCDLFSDIHLSLVADAEIEPKREDENSNAILVQLNLEKIDESSQSGSMVDLSKFLPCSKQKQTQCTIPTEIPIDIPTAAENNKSISIQESSFIESFVKVDGIAPSMMAVSGARRLGAILSENGKLVALIDMEQESGDNSYEDEGATEFSSETLSEVSL